MSTIWRRARPNLELDVGIVCDASSGGKDADRALGRLAEICASA